MGYTTRFTGYLTITGQDMSLADYNALKRIHDDGPHPEVVFSYGTNQTKVDGYCQWEVNSDGTELRWDGGEKFYGYTEWLQYLIAQFFVPRGYVLNGRMDWSGEEVGDVGSLIVDDNILTVREATLDDSDLESYVRSWVEKFGNDVDEIELDTAIEFVQKCVELVNEKTS